MSIVGMAYPSPGMGAFYPVVHKDRDGKYLTGDHNYRLHLPPNIPAKLFWSVTVYDAANSSGLDNGQPFPSLGSRDKPVMNADGSVDLYFGDMAPAGKEKTAAACTGQAYPGLHLHIRRGWHWQRRYRQALCRW